VESFVDTDTPPLLTFPGKFSHIKLLKNWSLWQKWRSSILCEWVATGKENCKQAKFQRKGKKEGIV